MSVAAKIKIVESNTLQIVDQQSTHSEQVEILLESIQDIALIQSRSREIVSFNAAALDILGAPESHLALQPTNGGLRLVTDEEVETPPFLLPATTVFRTGVAQRNQIINVSIGESHRLFSVSAVPFSRAADGSVQQVLITLRKVSAETSQVKETSLAAAFDAMPCLVSYINHDYTYQYVNATYEKWHSVKRGNLENVTVESVVGSESFARLRPRLDAAFAGETQVFEIEMFRGKPNARITQITYIPDVTEGNVVRGVLAIVYDISSQVKSHELLLAKEQEVSRILNSLPNLIGYFDRNATNIKANTAYAAHFNTTPDEIKGKNLADLLSPVVYEKVKQHIASALAGQSVSFETSYPLPNGEKKDLFVNYIPDFKSDEVVGFYINVTDISQLRNLERDQREIQSKLIATSKMSVLGEMAGGIAHEINNPLAIISGLTGLLREAHKNKRLDDKRLETSLQKIDTTVARIARIVRGLRVYARDAEKDSKQAVALDAIIEETLELCREKIRNRSIELRPVASSGALVNCNPTQISQILMNLIGNSVDAISESMNPWIEITISKMNDRVHLRVRDSGAGIPAEVVERMMNPFFTTKPVGQGTGLGLSISKGLAESNGGTLRYELHEGHTSFVLEL